MPSTMVSEFYTKVARKLGMTPTTDEQTAILQALNDGYEDLAVRLRCDVQEADVPLTADENDYDLDTDILAIVDMSCNEVPMVQVTPQEMTNLRASTNGSAAQAKYYAIMGANRFKVWPTPESGESINLEYVARPTPLTTDSQVPSSVPFEFHKLLEWYAIAELAEDDDHQPSKFGLHYRAMYEKGVFDAQRAIRRKGGKVAAARVGGNRDTRSGRLRWPRSTH